MRKSDGVHIMWGVSNPDHSSERPALAIQSPMRSAYATSPSISAPPLSASSSYASSVPTYSEEGVDDHERDASRLGVYRSTAAAPPISPPRVSNHGPPGAFLGVPPLRVDDEGQHPPHVNCPDALSCLQDTNDKPSYTLPIIIRAAILGTASGRLTITDIYAAIIEKYPYFATLPPDDSWKVCLHVWLLMFPKSHRTHL